MTIASYIQALPEERQVVVEKLHTLIVENLPAGFKPTIGYKMLAYVVPHKLYPDGYHCDTSQPLPFMNLASQKNYIALYHMGIYSDPDLLAWFKEEYAKYSRYKLDMGKSCVRFKRMDDIPYELIAQLCQKMTPQDWITRYEAVIKS